MNVINILKDGSIVDDMSKVEVPEEILKSIKEIGEQKNEKTN